MKKSLTELFDLPIEEVRNNFPITQPYTWAIGRLKDQREAIVQSGHWVGKQDELMYIDEAIKHYQGNLDEWYRGSNTAVRTAKDDEHYDISIRREDESK